jgi:hypothetical protein
MFEKHSSVLCTLGFGALLEFGIPALLLPRGLIPLWPHVTVAAFVFLSLSCVAVLKNNIRWAFVPIVVLPLLLLIFGAAFIHGGGISGGL